MSDNNI